MKKTIALAALLLASTSAFAQNKRSFNCVSEFRNINITQDLDALITTVSADYHGTKELVIESADTNCKTVQSETTCSSISDHFAVQTKEDASGITSVLLIDSSRAGYNTLDNCSVVKH